MEKSILKLLVNASKSGVHENALTVKL
jgi:hypothetical protein